VSSGATFARRLFAGSLAVTEELPDDMTLIIQVLFDIRTNTEYIIDLLEEDDGEEEADDA